MGKRRFEVATVGVDETLQGLSTDPFYGAKGTPSLTGLRVPSLVNTRDTRYLFLLATRVCVNVKTRILGIRQGVDIGMDLGPLLSLPAGQTRVVSLPVTTPNFVFSDGGNVSWHLVKEPVIKRTHLRKKTQAPSFAFVQADSPALLYQSFAASNVTGTGAPVNYPIDLTAYGPPKIPTDWKEIAGLKTLHDLRYPWADNQAWGSIEEVVEGGTWRISLYASVLQTNPATRPGIVYGNPGGNTIAVDGSAVGGPPEEDFIYKYTFNGETVSGPIFWRVYGSILFEDEIDGGDLKQL